MTEFAARWSVQANADIDEIITFILEKWSSKTVEKFIQRLESAQHKLIRHPAASPMYDAHRNVRIHKVDDHIALFYRVHDDHVEILRAYPYRKDRSNLSL
jgi:plasmid stabilization system protein ParE